MNPALALTCPGMIRIPLFNLKAILSAFWGTVKYGGSSG